MSFPVTVKHYAARAKIYRRTKEYPYYRVTATVAGRRQLQSFATYSKALSAVKKVTKDIPLPSISPALACFPFHRESI